MKLKKINNKWYFVASEFIIKGSVSGVLFLLSYFLTPAEYGYLNLFNSILTLSLTFASLNMTRNYITRSYYDETKDMHTLVSTIASFLLILSVVEVLLFAPLLFLGRNIASVPAELFFWGITVAVSINFYEIIQSSFIARREGILYFMSALIHGTTFAVLVFVFLFTIPSMRIYAFIVARLISSAGMSVFAFFYLRKYYNVRFKIDFLTLRESLRYSVPLIFSTVSGFLLNYISRFLINSISGIQHSGTFSFAQNIAMIPGLLLGAINNSFVPSFYKSMNEKKHKSIFHMILRNCTLIICTMVLFCIAIDYAMFLLPKHYQGQQGLIYLLIMSHTFHFGYMVYGNYLYYSKDTIVIFLSTLGAGITNTLLGYVLISRIGNWGGALATLVSYIFIYFSYHRFARRKFDQRVFPLSVLTIAFVAASLYIILYYSVAHILWFKLVITFAGVAASIFALSRRGAGVIERIALGSKQPQQ